MVAFLRCAAASKLSRGAFALSGLRAGPDVTLCSVTLTMVALLCIVRGSTCGGGEGDREERPELGRLADLLTFLEEMVIEENPALFWGVSVVTAELVCTCEGCKLLFALSSGPVDFMDWKLFALCKDL